MIKYVLSLLMLISICLTPLIAEAKQIIKIGLGDPLKGEMGAFSLRFKEIVESRSHGEIEIALFPDGILGDEAVMVQNVAAGTLDMAIIGVGNTIPFVPELGVLTLPYLFENIDLVIKGTTGKAQEILNTYVEKSSFQILAWVYNDYRHISNSKKPIRKIEDIKNMKFRVPLNSVFIESYKSWDADPIPIPWNNTYNALKSGIVDGQCLGFLTFQAVKFYEANQKYISKIHYTYHLQPLIIGDGVLESLDEETQKLLFSAAKDAQIFTLVYQYTHGMKAQEELKNLGVQIIDVEDEEKWKKAAIDKVWPNMINFLGGKEIVNTYLEAIGIQSIK